MKLLETKHLKSLTSITNRLFVICKDVMKNVDANERIDCRIEFDKDPNNYNSNGVEIHFSLWDESGDIHLRNFRFHGKDDLWKLSDCMDVWKKKQALLNDYLKSLKWKTKS